MRKKRRSISGGGGTYLAPPPPAGSPPAVTSAGEDASPPPPWCFFIHASTLAWWTPLSFEEITQALPSSLHLTHCCAPCTQWQPFLAARQASQRGRDVGPFWGRRAAWAAACSILCFICQLIDSFFLSLKYLTERKGKAGSASWLLSVKLETTSRQTLSSSKQILLRQT